MAGKKVTELDVLPSFTDTSLLPVHNGSGLKKGLLSQLASYLGTKFSNPNLLINPDFRINQRGETSYTSAVAQTIKNVYSVDRWCLYGHSLTVNSDKSVTITPTTYSDGALIQNLETPVDGNITVQVYAVGVSGTATVSVRLFDDSSNAEIGTLKNGLNTFTFSKGIKKLIIRVKSGTLTLKYAKVEQGKVATSFIAPNIAEELTKCYRFYQRMKPHYSGYVAKFQTTFFPIPIKAQTRTTGTIKVSDQQNSYNITGVSTMWSVGSDDYNKCPYVGFTTDSDGYARLNCIVEIDAEIY